MRVLFFAALFGALSYASVLAAAEDETTFLVASPVIRRCSFAITNNRASKEFVGQPYFENVKQEATFAA